MWNYVASVFLQLLLLRSGQGSDQPCSYLRSVDITDGELASDGSILHEGISYGADEYFVNGDDRRGCVCLKKTCFRKCCPSGQGMAGKACLASDEPSIHRYSPPVYDGNVSLPDFVASERFSLVFGIPCKLRYLVKPWAKKNNQIYLQKDGSIYLHYGFEPVESYCIDVFLKDPDDDPEGTPNPNWTPQTAAVICFKDHSESTGHTITRALYSIGMIISIPFLMITLAVYAFVPELRNLHGKSLMCYICSITCGYLTLAPLQFSSFSSSISNTACVVVAFIGYFSILATFFWLSVMCFDIWWTFSGLRGFSGSRRATERKRFILYSLFGWGGPLLIISFALILQIYPNMTDNLISPNFGISKCWFQNWMSEMVYLYTPMIVLVLVNLSFFAITACKIVEIKKDTAMLQNNESSRHAQYEKDTQRFKLYLKLFIVMGVNWIAEFISFLLNGNDYGWILTDMLNTAVGIYIFFIFVWKRKVKKLVVKRYHLIRYGPDYHKTPQSSSIQTTASSVEPDKTSSFYEGVRLQEIDKTRNNM